MQLEVLVLEDAAGGRVPVGDTEQPVLVTAAMAPACQLRQESQLQGNPPGHPRNIPAGYREPRASLHPCCRERSLNPGKAKARHAMAWRDSTELCAYHQSSNE